MGGDIVVFQSLKEQSREERQQNAIERNQS